jgi:hypothetical protein
MAATLPTSNRPTVPWFAVTCVALILLCCSGFAWVAWGAPETSAAIELDGYTIRVVERQEDFGAYLVTYWEVTRADGAQYRTMIAFHANMAAYPRCASITTGQVGARVYFRCNANPIDDSTPYVDTTRRTIYPRTWHEHMEAELAELEYRRYGETRRGIKML